MFDWFTRKEEETAGLQKMRSEFGQMLDAGRQAFEMGANMFLAGTDPEVIRQDLFATDKRINRAERQIRKEIVVHATVHGVSEFTACLVLMSIVKDAERIGDNSKNLYDLALLAPSKPDGSHRDTLLELKASMLEVMADCRETFDANNKDQARRVIVSAREIEDRCDEHVEQLIRGADPRDMAPAYVLAYRYFKRIVSHTRNIASSVVQPVHKLDFTSKITLDEG